MTVLLSVEDLLVLVDDLGVGPVRDVGLLDSAAHRPGVVLYGHEAYPTLDLKAAALLASLVGNHALVDGNNRLGGLPSSSSAASTRSSWMLLTTPHTSW